MTVLTSLVAALALGAAALTAPASSPDTPPGVPEPAVTPVGDAVWPLDPAPEVAAGFDPPEQVWSAGHRGVDLVGEPGQVVRAALTGTVSFAGRVAGRGVVSVDHGGRRTTYEPVTAAVTRGEEVQAGTGIGFLETGAGHCLPRACLHWGLVSGETYLDPLSLLGLGPVRLLPVQ